jgi:peptidoglycan/LPS O-acetylase OafA/YrhL
MSETIKKIDQLESLRGIAALLVVLYHVPAWNPMIHNISIIRSGFMMVDLFFVLSGFVIYTAYANRINSFYELAKFQFLRFGRLYPVHLLFLILFLGIEILKYVLQHHFGIASLSKQPFEHNNLAAFMRDVFMIKAFWPNEQAITFNSPAWSISAEFYTYLIFGLIVLNFAKFKDYIFAALGLSAALILFIYQPEHHDFMLRCIAGFFIGCMLALGISKAKDSMILSPYWIPACFLLIGAFMVFGHDAKALKVMIYPLTCLLISAILLSRDHFWKHFLSHPALVWLGTISFSLYMSHGLVLWFYQQVIRILFHRPEMIVEGLSTPQFELPMATLLNVVFLVVCLLLAHTTYRLIEGPFRAKSRHLIKLRT